MKFKVLDLKYFDFFKENSGISKIGPKYTFLLVETQCIHNCLKEHKAEMCQV